MKGRLLAASGQSSLAAPAGPEAQKAQVSSPKEAKVSIVDLLLGGKRQLPGGPGESVNSGAGAVSESSLDLL